MLDAIINDVSLVADGAPSPTMDIEVQALGEAECRQCPDTPVLVILEGDAVIEEGSPARYTIKLLDGLGNAVDVPPDESIMVDLAYFDITAQSEDFATAPVQITIGPNQNSADFSLDLADNQAIGPGAGYTVTISGISQTNGSFDNIHIDAFHGMVQTTIQDNNAPPVLQPDAIVHDSDNLVFDDILTGNHGNDLLDGEAGLGALSSGTGDDILFFDTAADNNSNDLSLIIDNALNLTDLTGLGRPDLDNIETVRLVGNATMTLSVSDVLGLTNKGNTLFIQGDHTNQVYVSGMNKESNSDHEGYSLYTGTDSGSGAVVALYIDRDVNDNLI